VAFWRRKLNGNVKRDRRAVRRLRRAGWRVRVLWECRVSGRALEGLGRALGAKINREAS